MSIRKYTLYMYSLYAVVLDIKFSFFLYDTNFDFIIFCFRKAIKFYMYDICVNPLRLDSWAGLALARMYQLEQKLNSVSGSTWKKFFQSFFSFFLKEKVFVCCCEN